MFSVDFCILYARSPPYFYFRFVWPTDLESTPHASTHTSIILTNFEVDMTIHCRVIAFLSAHTLRDLVTLTLDLLTLNSCRTWRVTWPTLPQVWRSYAYLFFRYELSLKFCTLPGNRDRRIELRCLNLHWKFINNRFCACEVQMLLKMAVSATICSTFQVQYGKSTSMRTTAIGQLRHFQQITLFRACAETHTFFNMEPCIIFADNFNYFNRRATEVAQWKGKPGTGIPKM